MRSYSNNLLFIVVMLTTLKVSQGCDCIPRRHSEASEQPAVLGACSVLLGAALSRRKAMSSS